MWIRFGENAKTDNEIPVGDVYIWPHRPKGALSISFRLERDRDNPLEIFLEPHEAVQFATKILSEVADIDCPLITPTSDDEITDLIIAKQARDQ